jgi:poly-gamma-glutamate synthesis protein (capsule biosynthesis protein)
MLGENYNHINRGIRSRFSSDFSSLLPPLVKDELLKDVDCVFYNFEYSVVPSLTTSFKSYEGEVYISETSSINLFPSKIKKIVNIANNHFSQHGNKVAAFTKNILKKNGFVVVGESSSPVEIQINSIDFLCWGVSFIKENYFCGEYFKSTYLDLIQDLNLPTKKDGEKWIISIHWGDEYISSPSEEQIKLAHKLIDLGFDLIMGHHPHVVQPVEKYNGSIIIYSLGNFIFDQNFSKRTQIGYAAKIVMEKDGVTLRRLYKTFQKKYFVSKIKEIKFYNIIQKKILFYRLRLKTLSLTYRVLMKIEVLFHFYELDAKTVAYYKKFAFKKLKNKR